MKQVIVLSVILCVSQVVQSATIDSLSFQTSRVSPKDCKKPGKDCADCQTPILCTDLGNNEWDVEILAHCDKEDNLSCMNGACTNKTNPDCGTEAPVQFPCSNPGMFPDQFDCQTYHMCCPKTTVSDGIRCDKGFMYDPVSTYCKTPMPPAGCPATSTITCKELGETAANPLNKSIYYTCVMVEDKDGNEILYPTLHVCPNGKVHNLGKCA